MNTLTLNSSFSTLNSLRVENIGFEPMTLPTVNVGMLYHISSRGEYRIRTDDPLLAKQVL